MKPPANLSRTNLAENNNGEDARTFYIGGVLFANACTHIRHMRSLQKKKGFSLSRSPLVTCRSRARLRRNCSINVIARLDSPRALPIGRTITLRLGRQETLKTTCRRDRFCFLSFFFYVCII